MKEKHKIYDFFISHSELENDEAEKLYNLLNEINPEWEIFFDKRNLEKESEWSQKMFEAAEYSKHLIFLAKIPDTLKFRNRWVSKEVDFFYNLQATGERYGKGHLNISYFGIIYGWDLEKELFTDDEYGSKYRAMYTSPNHLIIKQDESVADYLNSIKAKALNMTSVIENPMPALLLDRAYKYSSVKAGEDINFKKERIIDSLIPNLSHNMDFFSFNQLLSVIQNKDIAIIGNEGGSGKTTMLTKMFFHFLENAEVQNTSETLIPIYIEANTLAGSDYLIMRNIAKNLFGENTATSFDSFETGKIIRTLENEFSLDTEKPNYLLLIDGYNEISDGVLSKFNNELNEYLDHSKYKNIRIVLSGRNVDENLSTNNLIQYNIARIDFSRVRAFLDENSLTKTVSTPLLNILSIPMYLTMYVNMATEDKINTRGDLLKSFVERQLVKDNASAANENQAALYAFFLKSLLPFIAYRLVTKDHLANNFELSYDEMLDITTVAMEHFNSREYKSYVGEEGRKILRLSGISNMDEYDLSDLAVEYYTKVSKLLRKSVRQDENGKKNIRFDFIHQVYRDFFASTYIYEDICFAAETQAPCRSLEKPVYEQDIIQLTSELLGESIPYFDKETNSYNYDCNKSSRLIRLIENSRQNSQCENADFLRGVINLLRFIRKYNLSGCDFSGLNLTKANFCSAILSKFDAFRSYPSSFKNSKINSENLLISSPASHIMAACSSENTVAIFDATGTLSLWKKAKFDNNPLKIINNIYYRFHKIIFSKDNKKIYGMAGHTIVEIAIPEGKFGGEIKELYSTNKRLRDMFLDKTGELYFTTVFNSYNPKPVSNPDEPDHVGFYGINSASAVRHDKMQIAFGYIAGYNGFKLYNSNEEKTDWFEVKLGVSRLIDECIQKIEKFLKNEGLYEQFYNKRENEARHYLKKLEYYRSAFFKDLILKYNNEHADYDNIPSKICNSVFDGMNQLKIPTEKALPFLTTLSKEYKFLIAELEKNNRALTYMHGRKISSMEYKPGTDILLVTYYNDYVSKKDRKHYYHTTVAELNTTDLSSQIIHICSGHSRIHAMYSGDDIVIIAPDKLWIANRIGTVYTFPVVYNNMPHYFYAKDSDTFYMHTSSGTYEFNSDFVCIKNFTHNFDRNAVSLMIAEDSTPYIANQRALDNYVTKRLENNISKEVGINMMNLKNGMFESVCDIGQIISAEKVIPEFFGRTITNRPGTINFYKDGVAEYTIQIQRNLYVSGCDFSSISGNLTDSKYMDILNFYGATTDKKAERAIIEKKELDFSFTPSAVPFEEPEKLKDFISPYIFEGYQNYKKHNEETISSKASEIWPKIQKSSYKQKDFEPSDFSILEWVNSLNALSPEMVYYLMNAGYIEKPNIYTLDKNKIARRMNKTLFQNLKLLKRFDSPNGNNPVFTLSAPYGTTLLSRSTNAHIIKVPYQCTYAIKTAKVLLLNLWFSYNLMKLKDSVVAYGIDTYFETDFSLLPVKKEIRRYIKFKNSSIFTRIIRGNLNNARITKNRGIIRYFCDLASNYPYLLRNGINEGLVSAPVIVIVGQDFEYCRTLNEALSDIAPHIRKVYTYDALIHHCIANDLENMYVEFNGNNAFSVNMKDLL